MFAVRRSNSRVLGSTVSTAPRGPTRRAAKSVNSPSFAPPSRNHAGLEKPSQKHELVGSKGAKDVQAEAEIVTEVEPQAETVVPAEGERRIDSVLAIVIPDVPAAAASADRRRYQDAEPPARVERKRPAMGKSRPRD
jgi:hypothetical protein